MFTHRCHICLRSFELEVGLHAHGRTHSEEEIFDGANYRIDHHEGPWDDIDPVFRVPREYLTISPFSCPLCASFFPSLGEIRKHGLQDHHHSEVAEFSHCMQEQTLQSAWVGLDPIWKVPPVMLRNPTTRKYDGQIMTCSCCPVYKSKGKPQAKKKKKQKQKKKPKKAHAQNDSDLPHEKSGHFCVKCLKVFGTVGKVWTLI